MDPIFSLGILLAYAGPVTIFALLLYVAVRLAVRHAIRDIIRSTGGHGIYADGRTTSEPAS